MACRLFGTKRYLNQWLILSIRPLGKELHRSLNHTIFTQHTFRVTAIKRYVWKRSQGGQPIGYFVNGRFVFSRRYSAMQITWNIDLYNQSMQLKCVILHKTKLFCILYGMYLIAITRTNIWSSVGLDSFSHDTFRTMSQFDTQSQGNLAPKVPTQGIFDLWITVLRKATYYSRISRS